MNEFENLIASFNNLSTFDKEKEIYEEIVRIKSILDTVLQSNKDLVSADLVKFNSASKTLDDAFVKIYHNLMLIEEGLVLHLKNNGY